MCMCLCACVGVCVGVCGCVGLYNTSVKRGYQQQASILAKTSMNQTARLLDITPNKLSCSRVNSNMLQYCDIYIF